MYYMFLKYFFNEYMNKRDTSIKVWREMMFIEYLPCGRYCARPLDCVTSFNPCNMGGVIISISQIRRLRCRES